MNTLERRNQNTSWAFQVDPVHHYAYYDTVFSVDECKQVIEIGESLFSQKASVSGTGVDSKIRNSKISWINPNEDTFWMFRKLTDAVTGLNNAYFGFDIFGFIEGFQFTKYEAPFGFYEAHMDSSPGIQIRKLSITLQLNSPDEYEGGGLCIWQGKEKVEMQKKQGHLTIFPSYMVHEVQPVTKGTRYSLVAWITGNPFR
jgi:PKHD-type hydroxylase